MMLKLPTPLGNEFLKNISVIVSGTAIAQFIAIASSPILTRQYEVEAFGVLGIFMALVGMGTTLSTGRYSMAVLLPKDEIDSVNLLVLACFLSVCTAALGLLALTFDAEIGVLLGAPALTPYLTFVPLMIVLNGWHETLDYWMVRNKRFRLVSLAIIAGAVIGNGWRVGVGFTSPSTIALLLGAVFLSLVQMLVLFISAFNNLWAGINLYATRARIKTLAREYRQFPFYRAPKDFLNSLSQNLPSLLLAIFFNPSQVGLFLLADRILRVPSALLGQAVRKVFFQKATETYRADGSLLKPVLRVTLGLAVVGVIPFFFVGVYGPELFGLVFGTAWTHAGEYGRWMAVWMFFGFINVPSVVTISILRMEMFFLKFELVNIIGGVVALMAGALIFQDDLYAIILFSLHGALLNIFLMLYVLWVLTLGGTHRATPNWSD